MSKKYTEEQIQNIMVNFEELEVNNHFDIDILWGEDEVTYNVSRLRVIDAEYFIIQLADGETNPLMIPVEYFTSQSGEYFWSDTSIMKNSARQQLAKYINKWGKISKVHNLMDKN